MRTKALFALLATATCALALLTAPAANAATAVTCYGGARGFDAGIGDQGGDFDRAPGRDVDDGFDVSDGAGNKYYVASDRCKDVNVYIANYGGTPYLYAQVCYPNGGCESPVRFNQGEHYWKVIKYGVPNGTWFYVKFDWNAPRFYGSVAY